MGVAHPPISAAEADALFAPLRRFDALLLAVSGGVDSTALLELIAEWRLRTIDGPAISVATVDHQLRREARDEAAFAAARCAELKLRHAILTWSGDKPASGVASAARDARYALLRDHAMQICQSKRCAIVTAHTEDDQAETVAMRLARGSGFDGLSAMAPERAMAGSPVMLARPLLAVPKARLIATMQVRGLAWREDPSNANQLSERVRVRRALDALADAGVSATALATTARRMGDARDAIAFADHAFAETLSLDVHDEIFASLDRARFDEAPALLRQRLLHRLIQRFGGETPPPRLSEVEDLAARLALDPSARLTLGGAVVSSKSRVLRVWREAGRIGTEDFVLPPDDRALWDNRFWLQRQGRPDLALTVRPLGRDGARDLGVAWTKDSPPAAAVAALPGIWTDGQLIAAPSLSGVATAMQPGAFASLRISATAVGGAIS